MKETVFFDGQSYFDALLLDIQKARKSIQFETYIFKLDNLGKKILAALSAAARRGVSVRLLVDGVGTSEWFGEEVKAFEAAGGIIRIFHSLPWRLWQWSRTHIKGSALKKAIYLLLKINSRNHRKVCFIDKKVAYVGSFNVGEEQLEKYRREAAVRLENYDLKDLSMAFEAAWSYFKLRERIKDFFRHLQKDPVFRLNNAWYRRRFLYKNLLRRMRKCKRRIWVTNAYFVPNNSLLRRLREAARNGVDVRILLPQKADILFMPWAAKFFYAELLKSGVHIYEYLPGILHAKTLILDNWMLIGSSNLNYRSILHDLEVDVNIRSSQSKNMLTEQFLIDLKSAAEITLDDWRKRPFYQRSFGRLVLYAKYLI